MEDILTTFCLMTSKLYTHTICKPTYYHIVCSPNTSTTVEAFEATLPLEPQVRTWGSAVAAPIWVLLILSNVGGGVFTILFAILFHGHMEATDVGATASSMPGLRNRLHGRVSNALFSILSWWKNPSCFPWPW